MIHHDPIDAPNIGLIFGYSGFIYIYIQPSFKVYSISPNNVYNYDGFP